MSLRLDLHPSRRFAALLSGVYLASAGVLLALPIPAWLGLPLAALCVGDGWRVVRERALLRGPRAFVRVDYTAQSGWRLGLADGAEAEVALSPDSYVHPWLVVLNFTGRGRKRRSVTVLPDSLDTESFRRLRVVLTRSRELRAGL